MRKSLTTYLLPGTLIAGLAFAQDASKSVETVLQDLGAYTAARSGQVQEQQPAPAAVQAAPAVVEETAAEQTERRGWFSRRRGGDEPAAAVVAEADEPVAQELAPAVMVIETAADAQDIDIPAVLDASRALYVGGEFERAQRGFEAVVKKDPDNLLAKLYLRRILERGHRRTQVAAVAEISEAWDGRMVLRTYPVSGDGQRKMELSDLTEPTDVIAKFPEVDFPKGSSAVYQPATGKIFVRNTRENLAVIEEIFDAMDVHNHRQDIDQVEIEAKFVEVAAGTLEQLGFEWYNIPGAAIGRPARDISGGINDVVIPEGQNLFVDSLRSGRDGLPFSRPSDLGDGRGAANLGTPGSGFRSDSDWTTFRFEDTFNRASDSIELQWRGSTPLDIIISALDQVSGTDVLSAPRVVTRSGETARIRVGQLHYLPEVYEVGADGGTIIHVKYEDFVETLLGVELEVTPRVDAGQITMGLNPVIRELAGWRSYYIAPPNSSYTHYQGFVRMQYFHDEPIMARLPIYTTRRINTEVTIADGGTIGMGGLINERVESFKDKVPVLGSLPLLGRLFRSEGERSVKRNLLIFVSAKTVDPSGRVNTSRSFAGEAPASSAPASGRSLFF